MNDSAAVPLVTVVIPCRNEERFIDGCLSTLMANDYPPDRLEVLLVDGESSDRTLEIVRAYSERHAGFRIIRNRQRTIPAAMNLGISEAKGDIILKIDAHADYDSSYVSSCVKGLIEHDADCVGGVLITVPSHPTLMGRTIAAVLSHGFGSGNAAFRLGVSEPIWADTAAFGCYRRDVFTRIGVYDERLIRSSDMDLNTRLRRSGGRILLSPEIRARYFCRSTAGDFATRNLLDGFWALYPIRFGSRLMRPRHLLPGICALVGIVLLIAGLFIPVMLKTLLLFGAAYALLALTSGLSIARQEHDLRFVFLATPIFMIRHSAYAVGSLWGGLSGISSRLFRNRMGDGKTHL